VAHRIAYGAALIKAATYRAAANEGAFRWACWQTSFDWRRAVPWRRTNALRYFKTELNKHGAAPLQSIWNASWTKGGVSDGTGIIATYLRMSKARPLRQRMLRGNAAYHGEKRVVIKASFAAADVAAGFAARTGGRGGVMASSCDDGSSRQAAARRWAKRRQGAAAATGSMRVAARYQALAACGMTLSRLR